MLILGDNSITIFLKQLCNDIFKGMGISLHHLFDYII